MIREVLLVDGYNLMHAARDAKLLDADDLAHDRDTLADWLANYAAFNSKDSVLVFDGAGRTTDLTQRPGLQVVFTRRDVTADTYIERAAHLLVRKGYRVSVVTSDYEEQKSVFGSGAIRVSSREFLQELAHSKRRETHYTGRGDAQRNPLDSGLSRDVVRLLHRMRKGAKP